MLEMGSDLQATSVHRNMILLDQKKKTILPFNQMPNSNPAPRDPSLVKTSGGIKVLCI